MIQNRSQSFSLDVLRFDVAAETERIVEKLKVGVFNQLRKRGGVVGVSGGVDSAAVLALAINALGNSNVLALLLPERETSNESLQLAINLCKKLDCRYVIENITDALTGFGAYKRRDRIVSDLFPEYNASYRLKITIPEDLLLTGSFSFYELSIISCDGKEQKTRLNLDQLRGIVAATNFKQRSRAAMLYYHGELNNFAVIGTSQRNEHDLGFFVKYGDSAVDVRPLGHLYKTQVYYLAEYLGIPSDILSRPPTSETFSASSNQTEFFFRVPYQQLDLIWYAFEHDIPVDVVASELGLSVEQVDFVITDIKQKQRTTKYLREHPIVLFEDRQ